MGRTDSEHALGPLEVGLADADQDPGREGNREPSGVLEHLKSDGWLLVRRSVVRLDLVRSTAGRWSVSSIMPIDGATGLSCTSSATT